MNYQSLKVVAIAAVMLAATAAPSVLFAQSSATNPNGSTSGSTQLNTQPSNPNGQTNGSTSNSTSTTTTNTSTPAFLNNLTNLWWLLPLALVLILVALLASSGSRTTRERETYRSDVGNDVGLSGVRGGAVERRREVTEDDDDF